MARIMENGTDDEIRLTLREAGSPWKQSISTSDPQYIIAPRKGRPIAAGASYTYTPPK